MNHGFGDPALSTRDLAEMVRSPRRMLPSKAAVEYGLADKEGNSWSADVAPYMVEPLDFLADRRYQELVFVGPARASKTFTIVHGAVNYAMTCDPGDIHIIQMTHDAARGFSQDEVGPVIRNSRGLREAMSPRSKDDNTFDKRARHGARLVLGWPAITQVSSYTSKYMIVTDYDRPKNRDNVDGEGPLFDLATKRTTTYMSRGKTIVESSPGEDYFDPSWSPASAHEAPPALGIAELYNRGTRGRYYWACKGCGSRMHVTPGTDMFGLPEYRTLRDMVLTSDPAGLVEEYSRIVCRKCGTQHFMADRRELNIGGRWLHEGEIFLPGDRISGTRRATRTASYWLGGAAAAYQRWDSMLEGYFQAIRTYELTGDEGSLRTKTNVDFGASYMPRSAALRRKAEDLIARAEDWPRGRVPAGVQFLTATIDIQNNRFVVVVIGWGAGREAWIVDRFSITHNPNRLDDAGRPAPVDPAVHDEDWDLLISSVMDRRYALAEDPETEMAVYVTGSDSGGKAGVHARAFDFWRRLKQAGRAAELKLLKGANTDTAPRIEERYPDARTKTDKATPSRGDVPVWFLNTTTYKDELVGDLGVDRHGSKFIHIPKWLDRAHVGEYVAETKTAKGWEKNTARNEQFDLHVYNRALFTIIGAERIDWSAPPAWAKRPSARGAQSRDTIASGATIAQRMQQTVAAPVTPGGSDIASRMAALARR